jgi:hypothetical protein
MVKNTYKNKNFTVAPRNNMGEKKIVTLNYLQPTILLYASGAVQKDELGNT